MLTLGVMMGKSPSKHFDSCQFSGIFLRWSVDVRSVKVFKVDFGFDFDIAKVGSDYDSDCLPRYC